jgi:hypothetical protein
MSTTNWTILPFAHSASSSGRRSWQRAFIEALRLSGSGIIVDFTACSTLNHGDIALLLECLSQSAGRDTPMHFVAGSRVIRILLEVTRVASLVPVFDSMEEAIACPQIASTKGTADFRASRSKLVECVRRIRQVANMQNAFRSWGLRSRL